MDRGLINSNLALQLIIQISTDSPSAREQNCLHEVLGGTLFCKQFRVELFTIALFQRLRSYKQTKLISETICHVILHFTKIYMHAFVLVPTGLLIF